QRLIGLPTLGAALLERILDAPQQFCVQGIRFHPGRRALPEPAAKPGKRALFAVQDRRPPAIYRTAGG
ncbi:MAG: hypothetical protein ACKPE6_09065, partial [Gammaproteobacteria bacterium]